MHLVHVEVQLRLGSVDEERVDLEAALLLAPEVGGVEVLRQVVEVLVVDVREGRLAELALLVVALQVDFEGVQVEVVLAAEVAERVEDQQVLALVRLSLFQVQSEHLVGEDGLLLQQQRAVRDAYFAGSSSATRDTGRASF